MTLIHEVKPDALTVPEAAIVPKGEDQYVFKVLDGKAQLSRVSIGTRRERRVELVDGVSAGELVITAGAAQDPRRRGRDRGSGSEAQKLSEVSIHRPVFATVVSLVLTLVGLVAYSRLSVREYPNIDPPVVTVTTSYPGASAAIVETQVTKVLKDSLSGIEGIDYLTSISR